MEGGPYPLADLDGGGPNPLEHWQVELTPTDSDQIV